MGYEVIVVPPPSVCAVPARGREARKRNLSITSNPVSLKTFALKITLEDRELMPPQ